MSTEEDTELRDLVAQTLEVNGCLPKIRAELRASIFLALDQDEELQKKEPLLNKKLKTQLESPEGQIMFCLVREFLEFFNLDFTISVYEPESYLGTAYQYEGRDKVIKDLGITQLEENPTLPLLLQLIQIAQFNNLKKTKNINIKLTELQNVEEECSSSSDQQSSKPVSNKSKTDVDEVKDANKTSISEQVDHLEIYNSSNENSVNGVLNPVTEIHAVSTDVNLNKTFDVSSPINNLNEAKKIENVVKQDNKPKTSLDIILSPRLLESSKSGSEEKDDTYDGTSSLAEDSAKESSSLDLDKSAPTSEKSQSLSETEFSPPILKDSKSHSKFDTSFDKLKLSPQKTEKLKAKSSLSSLADLPPLQLNKSRNDTVLLPSLYSKDFKEKTTNQNLKEFDKFFDVDTLDNYEEDFMSDSEINLNRSLDNSKNNALDELPSSSVSISNKNTSRKSTQSKSVKNQKIDGENTANTNQNIDKIKTGILCPENANGTYTRDCSATSSIISDELNTNIDDILNSPTSN